MMNKVNQSQEHSGGESLLSPRPALDGWMPIETAPKDGTALLLVDEDGVQVVGFYGKHNHVPMYGWLRPVELYGEEVEAFDATHWMRLPASPVKIIDDGFGNSWSAICPECGEASMEIVRPGKVQCGQCG